MALIPFDTLTRLQVASQTDGTLAHLNQLNTNMAGALNATSGVPQDIQAKTFDQMYNHYHAFRNAQLNASGTGVQHLKIPFQNDATSNLQQPQANLQQPYGQDAILRDMPRNNRASAKTLLRIATDHPSITWDHDGAVSIQGQLVPGANIREIIHDLSRNYEKKAPAVGSLDVGRYLMAANAPETSIINKARRAELVGMPTTAAETPPFATPLVARIPTPHTSTGKRNRRLAARFDDVDSEGDETTPGFQSHQVKTAKKSKTGRGLIWSHVYK